MSWLRAVIRFIASLNPVDRLSVFAGFGMAVIGIGALLNGRAFIPRSMRFWADTDFQGFDAAVFGYFALMAAYLAVRHVLAAGFGRISVRADIGVAFGLLIVSGGLHLLWA